MKATLSRLAEVAPFLTKDGSAIRELMHPAVHGNVRQSLAEAEVPPGGATHRHRHRESEELYFILSGQGRMTLGEEEFPVAPGDTILIPPGAPHALVNPGAEPLRLLCACSPAYRHEDTELLD